MFLLCVFALYFVGRQWWFRFLLFIFILPQPQSLQSRVWCKVLCPSNEAVLLFNWPALCDLFLVWSCVPAPAKNTEWHWFPHLFAWQRNVTNQDAEHSSHGREMWWHLRAQTLEIPSRLHYQETFSDRSSPNCIFVLRFRLCYLLPMTNWGCRDVFQTSLQNVC